MAPEGGGAMAGHRSTEGLGGARFLIVLSSMSPVIILWGIRGSCLVSPLLWRLCCLLLATVPVLVLWLRIRRARADHDGAHIRVAETQDHDADILVYLFTCLLPLLSFDLDSPEKLCTAIAALAFVSVLFWRMNLHYMNVFLVLRGYHVFTVRPVDDGNPYSGRRLQVLITRREWIPKGAEIETYRLSNTVYVEREDEQEVSKEERDGSAMRLREGQDH